MPICLDPTKWGEAPGRAALAYWARRAVTGWAALTCGKTGKSGSIFPKQFSGRRAKCLCVCSPCQHHCLAISSLPSSVHAVQLFLSPATMARLQRKHQSVVGDNRIPSHPLYSSRAVNAAPAIMMEYSNSTTSLSQTSPSPLTQLHPSILPLLSYYLARYYAQQAEISTSKQAPLAFRKPRLLHQSPKHSKSSGRKRLHSQSRQSRISPTFRYILE